MWEVVTLGQKNGNGKTINIDTHQLQYEIELSPLNILVEELMLSPSGDETRIEPGINVGFLNMSGPETYTLKVGKVQGSRAE